MPTNLVTITLSPDVARNFATLPPRLEERLHVLLERSTDDQLNAMERDELLTLVAMAQFTQLVATAIAKRLR